MLNEGLKLKTFIENHPNLNTPKNRILVNTLQEHDDLCKNCMEQLDTTMLCVGTRPTFMEEESEQTGVIKIFPKNCYKKQKQVNASAFKDRLYNAFQYSYIIKNVLDRDIQTIDTSYNLEPLTKGDMLNEQLVTYLEDYVFNMIKIGLSKPVIINALSLGNLVQAYRGEIKPIVSNEVFFNFLMEADLLIVKHSEFMFDANMREGVEFMSKSKLAVLQQVVMNRINTKKPTIILSTNVVLPKPNSSIESMIYNTVSVASEVKYEGL